MSEHQLRHKEKVTVHLCPQMKYMQVHGDLNSLNKITNLSDLDLTAQLQRNVQNGLSFLVQTTVT